MLAVGSAKGILAVVGAFVHLAGKQGSVVTLLQLHRVRPTELRDPKELLALRDVTLMVVADLGDEVAALVVRDADTVDEYLPFHVPRCLSGDHPSVTESPRARR